MQLIILIIIIYFIYNYYQGKSDDSFKNKKNDFNKNKISNTTTNSNISNDLDNQTNFTQRDFQKRINTKIAEATRISENFNQDITKAVNAKRNGKLDLALEYYRQMEETYLNKKETRIEGMIPKIVAGKGKVLILKDRTIDAQKEFLKVIKWCKERSDRFSELNEGVKINCLSAFEHLGYCVGVGQWEDEKQYLEEMAGKKYKKSQYDVKEISRRTNLGLDVAKQKGIWCELFTEHKRRVESKLYSIN